METKHLKSAQSVTIPGRILRSRPKTINLISDKGIERVSLSPGDDPKRVFCEKPDADVYAYCNLHGLWKATG
ncbi:MAG TPA: hypothetical protein GXX59_06605 [Syntrophomonadaceae bacterium]|nr:hypothetical protein [Syntrophomonadaceae bacterium]